MADFYEMTAAMDAAVLDEFGERVTITRHIGGVVSDVRVVIDRGVLVELGDVATLGNHLTYLKSVTGALEARDRVVVLDETTGNPTGESYVLADLVTDDASFAMRVAMKE